MNVGRRVSLYIFGCYYSYGGARVQLPRAPRPFLAEAEVARLTRYCERMSEAILGLAKSPQDKLVSHHSLV